MAMSTTAFSSSITASFFSSCCSGQNSSFIIKHEGFIPASVVIIDMFIITIEASDYTLGAVLSNETTKEKPIAYASRSLVGAEKRCHPIENNS